MPVALSAALRAAARRGARRRAQRDRRLPAQGGPRGWRAWRCWRRATGCRRSACPRGGGALRGDALGARAHARPLPRGGARAGGRRAGRHGRRSRSGCWSTRSSRPRPSGCCAALELLEHARLVEGSPSVRLLLVAPPRAGAGEGRCSWRCALDVTAVLARQLEQLIKSGERRPRDAAVWALARAVADAGRAAVAAAAQVGRRGAALRGDRRAARLDRKVGQTLRASPMEETASVRLGREAFFARDGARAASTALEAMLANGARAPVTERREVARLLGRLADEERSGGAGALPRRRRRHRAPGGASRRWGRAAT